VNNPDKSPSHFGCGNGFLSAVHGRASGQFDGRDARTVAAYLGNDRETQLLVSMHEHLHHELQWSTVWGVTAAMAGLLAEEGVETKKLRMIAAAFNSGARRVHEVFATTLSCGVLGIETTRACLAEPYTTFLDDGLSLGGPANWPWQFRESASQMILRSMMQPRKLIQMCEAGFQGMRLRHLADEIYPDERLRTIASIAGRWWEDVFHDLLRDHPRRGGDTGGIWLRNIPGTPEEMDELKEWEETILIPVLQEHANGNLAALGIEVLDADEYLYCVDQLNESFNDLAPEEWQVEVLRDRRPMSGEPLGAEREIVQLRETRAKAVTVEEAELGLDPMPFFWAQEETVPHTLAIYVPSNLLREQFDGLDHLPATEQPLLALVGLAESDQLSDRVRLAFLQPSVTPRQLEDMFANTRHSTLTSLRTTRERGSQQLVLDTSCLMILVDLPLRTQVASWLRISEEIRFRVVQIESRHHLNLVVFHLAALPNCWFLSYRSDAGFGELAQLLDKYPELKPSLEIPSHEMTVVTSVSTLLTSSWFALKEIDPL
jgi:hypothetical protein